nr:imidazole glycerol phosphate synthase subunit HisH [uncultured Blautia sp.]
MIAIIDYGAGNLFSVKNALDFLKIENCVAKDPETIRQADAMILPGVGAFPDAMEMLERKGMVSVICEEAGKKPLLGICLGMQLLFESSSEFGTTKGLGLIPGKVIKIDSHGLKIPHMGWNDLKVLHPCAVTEEMAEDTYVYFVHSFRADTEEENISCYTEYGERIPALVHRGFVYGAQYHPEKSGEAGLKMLKNFAKLVKK